MSMPRAQGHVRTRGGPRATDSPALRARAHGVCALEAVPGKEQRHRVELLRADDADVCANPRVPCFELDVLAYRVARRTQLLDRRLADEPFVVQLQQPIARRPRQEAR